MSLNNPNICQLIEAIGKANPLQRSFLSASAADLNESEIESLATYIDYCRSRGLDLMYLRDCYDLIVKDTLREQIFFQKNHRYRFSTYSEVANLVYQNAAYMSKYMHGLAITSYLWPNHRAMRRFFLANIPKHVHGNYLEIGPGHGVYFTSAMNLASYDSYEGVDLSPTSIELTTAIVSLSDRDGIRKCELVCKNFLTEQTARPQYDAIVMGEVLEHVEEPVEFLKKIASLSHKDTFIYVTTAINAPAIDHIYLFDTVRSLEDMTESAGLIIRDRLILPYAEHSLEESLKMRLPINAALILGV